jgi:putative transposase
MTNTKEALEANGIYHIYSRANGFEKLFYKPHHFRYFMTKYHLHISPIAETYSYCLMPNHFHMVIKIKSVEAINACLSEKLLCPTPAAKSLNEKQHRSRILIQQFSNFLNAYSKALNLMIQRRGSLFMTPIRRKRIHDERYFRATVVYVHLNPCKAGLCKRPGDWPYSSYRELLEDGEGLLNRQPVLQHFGTREDFVRAHNNQG